MTRQGADPPAVHGITGARTRHSDDLEQRMVRYLVSMAIRTACVVLVLVVHHPVRWVFAVGAVVLPYIAVILANASGPRRGVRNTAAADLHGITTGTDPGSSDPASGGSAKASGKSSGRTSEPALLTGIVLPAEPAAGGSADPVDHAAPASGSAPGG